MIRDDALPDRFLGEGLTFDDVLLVPRHSEVHPRDTELKTRLTATIELQIPLLSAAMDTVTESEMAIAMAREGGIGIIHKNMSPDRQAREVDRVKRSESGMVENPVTVEPDATVREALRAMERYSISGVPIVSSEGKLVGILTNRDLSFEPDRSRSVRELMTGEVVTAPVGTSLADAERILHEHRIEKLPVVDDGGVLRGLITLKDIQKRRQFPNACKDERGRLRVGAAVGASSADLDRARAVLDAGADLIVVDTAHGHSEGVLKAVAMIRETFPDAQIVGGNVPRARVRRRSWSGGWTR
jgi:IMP dehydrogenase